jgi:ATP-binding cassette, subfamily B (MDR/TAP), member 1
LDGRNIIDYDIKTLRSYFGVVSQEPVVFNGTIRDNIVYNTPDMTEETIKKCAQQANAFEFYFGRRINQGRNQFSRQKLKIICQNL